MTLHNFFVLKFCNLNTFLCHYSPLASNIRQAVYAKKKEKKIVLSLALIRVVASHNCRVIRGLIYNDLNWDVNVSNIVKQANASLSLFKLLNKFVID